MVDYGLIAGVAGPLFGGLALTFLEGRLTKRLPRKHKPVGKMLALLSAFVLVAYGAADMAIVIHQAGAPSIFFVIPFAGLVGGYGWYFWHNVRKIRARIWRMWYMYVFGVSCFALAPVGYFLLMFSILELQYNIMPNL